LVLGEQSKSRERKLAAAMQRRQRGKERWTTQEHRQECLCHGSVCLSGMVARGVEVEILRGAKNAPLRMTAFWRWISGGRVIE
jgi:hypothetical protein